MDMHIQKIVFYCTYVDCLTRVIKEFIENGDDNIQPYDVSNLVELLSKMTCRLKCHISNMSKDWEFMD